MKLLSISIKNFRAIENIKIVVRNMTSLIGPNNCAKSSVLRAIELFLNQENPHIDEWRKGHTEIPIVIEGEFGDLQDWEKAVPGVAGIVHADRIRLKVSYSVDADSGKINKGYEAFKPEETITGWSDKWGELSPQIKEIAAEIDVTNGTTFRQVAKQEAIKQRIRDSHADLVTRSDAKWSADNISIPAALQQALPQAQLIPAVKDAADDSKPGAKTSFGIILSKILLPAIQESTEYAELLEAVQKLQAKLAATGDDRIEKVSQITEALSSRLSSIIDAKVLLSMSTPDAEKFIGSNTGLELDDGTQTAIGLQGNGLQRSLIFALMETLAAQAAVVGGGEGGAVRSRSTIILFEEPELFMHPHLMRSLRRALDAISRKIDWQVIVTTHSPFMIDIGEDPMSLVVFKRQAATHPPQVAQLGADPFGTDANSQRDREALRAVLDFHPTVCEAFFATRTVLVEGDSELAVLVHQPDLYAKTGVDLVKRKNCTVVSCGGKWTIAPIANLLERFGIPFRIIHDMDRKGRTEAELNESIPLDPFRANARIGEFAEAQNIFVVEDTLEDLFWDVGERPKSSGDKPYRLWKRVKKIIQDDEAIAPNVRELMQFAFNW